MRIHYLQHVPFEGLGFIEDWANEKRHSVTATKFFENDPLPEIHDFDLLIILGGPMNIHDEEEHSWLKAEKEFLKAVIGAEKKVLGICLGAQLLANVLGAKVLPNTEKEIGWFPIKKTANDSRILYDFPEEFTVFHWHGDTFETPENAHNLWYSEGCKNQAFLYQENVFGLQFHLEVSESAIGNLIENCRQEMTAGKYIQSETEILARTDLLKANKNLLYQLLNALENS